MIEDLRTIQFVDRESLHTLIDGVFKEMSIKGEPVGAEKLQKMIADHGAKPGENIFSKEIIEMREE